MADSHSKSQYLGEAKIWQNGRNYRNRFFWYSRRTVSTRSKHFPASVRKGSQYNYDSWQTTQLRPHRGSQCFKQFPVWAPWNPPPTHMSDRCPFTRATWQNQLSAKNVSTECCTERQIMRKKCSKTRNRQCKNLFRCTKNMANFDESTERL